MQRGQFRGIPRDDLPDPYIGSYSIPGEAPGGATQFLLRSREGGEKQYAMPAMDMAYETATDSFSVHGGAPVWALCRQYGWRALHSLIDLRTLLHELL